MGDRVALAVPGYPAYANILAALGCEVVVVPCGPETRYQPTVAQLEALDPPVDGLVVASPANPTGTMIDPDELAALAAWCGDARRPAGQRRDLPRHHLRLRGRPRPPPTTSTAAPSSSNSFSKYWAMTGWRLGWLVLPDDLVAAVDALAGNVALCPPALAQHAGVAAFSPEGYAAARQNVERYAAAREHLLARLPELGWSRIAPADGAFYLYGDISASGLDSITWCARLLDEAGVALTPGHRLRPGRRAPAGCGCRSRRRSTWSARRSTGSSRGSGRWTDPVTSLVRVQRWTSRRPSGRRLVACRCLPWSRPDRP